MDEKINFWKTDEGKILSYGIHEHNSGLGYINNSISLIKKLIERKQINITFKDIEIEDIFNRNFKMLEEGKIKCKESVDYIYKEIKALKEKNNG